MIEQSVRPARRWRTWALPLLVVAIVAGTAIWIWNSAITTSRTNTAPAAALPAGATQTNEGGQVTIAATLQESGAAPIFIVAMNTHAVDLDGYDLKQLAVVRIDGGQDVQPISWEAPKGGHHRSGTLTFPATSADGTPLITSGTQAIELVIHDIAGVPERSFHWALER
jgi:hypothetical protein